MKRQCGTFPEGKLSFSDFDPRLLNDDGRVSLPFQMYADQ